MKKIIFIFCIFFCWLYCYSCNYQDNEKPKSENNIYSSDNYPDTNNNSTENKSDENDKVDDNKRERHYYFTETESYFQRTDISDEFYLASYSKTNFLKKDENGDLYSETKSYNYDEFGKNTRYQYRETSESTEKTKTKYIVENYKYDNNNKICDSITKGEGEFVVDKETSWTMSSIFTTETDGVVTTSSQYGTKALIKENEDYKEFEFIFSSSNSTTESKWRTFVDKSGFRFKNQGLNFDGTIDSEQVYKKLPNAPDNLKNSIIWCITPEEYWEKYGYEYYKSDCEILKNTSDIYKISITTESKYKGSQKIYKSKIVYTWECLDL